MTKLAEFKTEKRPAKVGERILITNARVTGGNYSNGDIRKVTRVVPAGVNVVEHSLGIYHNEYEVITFETIEIGGDKMNVGIIEKMQAELARTKDEIEELKAKVAKLESAEGVVKILKKYDIEGEFQPAKTPQQLRDEIVAKAKADVEELVKNAESGFKIEGEGNYTYRERTNRVEFVVNAAKRTVVALVWSKYNPGELREKGIAKCAPNDCFNSHIGRAIALRRALGLPVPIEYLNAPQPTEARVGDIIRWNDGTDSVFKIADKVDNRYDFEVVRTNLPETSGYRTGLLLYKNGLDATIIDDSREGETQ